MDKRRIGQYLDLPSAMLEIERTESTVLGLRAEAETREAEADLELLDAFRSTEDTLGRDGAIALARQKGIDLRELEDRVASSSSMSRAAD